VASWFGDGTTSNAKVAAKDAGKATKEGGKAVASGAKEVGKATEKGTKEVGKATKEGTKAAAKGTKTAAKATKSAVTGKPANAPADATGQCNDGTFTTAKSHQGACSGHKGVKTWF
jgi:hypothetical protein